MAKRKKKKWIQSAIKRPGALTEYARGRGGLARAGTIKRSWARNEQRRLRAKKKRTATDTRRLRQLALYLNQLSKRRR